MNEAIRTLLHDTAIREHELHRLKIGDVDLDNGALIVRRKQSGWKRVVFLTPACAHTLRHYLAEERQSLGSAAPADLLFPAPPVRASDPEAVESCRRRGRPPRGSRV